MIAVLGALTVLPALLAVLGAPFLHVTFGGIDARALPKAEQARQVDTTLRTQFTQLNAEPIQVLVEGIRNPADPKLAGVDGVAVAGAGTKGPGEVLLSVSARGEAVDTGGWSW
jgi:RND superfamily putative drug exporter